MKHTKTIIAVLLTLTVFASCGSTKHYIGYTYKPMAVEGCDVIYSILGGGQWLTAQCKYTFRQLKLTSRTYNKLQEFRW